MMEMVISFSSQVIDQFSQTLIHKVQTVKKLQITQFEGNVLFCVFGNAGKLFLFVFSKILHEQMGIISLQVVKKHWDMLGIFKGQVAFVVGRSSVLSCQVAVISHFILGFHLLTTNMTLSGLIVYYFIFLCKVHGNICFQTLYQVL